MRRRFAALVASFMLVVSLAACASTQAAPDAESSPSLSAAASAAPAAGWETGPPQAQPRTSTAPARVPSAAVTLSPKANGWRIDELFEQVQAATGISFLYDSGNAAFKQAKVEFIGPFKIPEDQLFAWLQAVLSYRKLVLVPVGPKAVDGKQQWFVMDQADPNLKSRPVYIDESEILDYADRDGLYVVTTMRVRDMVDTSRVRNALAPLSTATAGIGRIQDVPGGKALIVGDFAPVIAAMKQVLDRINAAASPPIAHPAPAPAAK